MKKVIYLGILLLNLIHFSLDAQNEGKIIGNYYYLDFPQSNIFNSSFSIPTGKNDPFSIATISNEIVNEDLEVSYGASKQSRVSVKNKKNSFLFNTWASVKNIQISREFYNIKHTRVKNASWSKYNDEAFHVAEALSGDSVILKIIKGKADTAGTSVIQSITNLFLGKNTVVGKVLNLLGTKDSISNSLNEAVRLLYNSKDTLILEIKDNKVYFAVRYMQIKEPQYHKVWSFFIGTKIEAPSCAPKMQKNPPEIIKSTFGNKQKTYNLVGDNCSINNYNVKALFVNDFDDGGTVYIIKEHRGSTARITTTNLRKDTVYVSEPINFSDEYYNKEYNTSIPFVAGQVSTIDGAKNLLVVCDIKFKFNPENKTIEVKNYNSYYHTCIYKMDANIIFYPK